MQGRVLLESPDFVRVALASSGGSFTVSSKWVRGQQQAGSALSGEALMAIPCTDPLLTFHVEDSVSRANLAYVQVVARQLTGVPNGPGNVYLDDMDLSSLLQVTNGDLVFRPQAHWLTQVELVFTNWYGEGLTLNVRSSLWGYPAEYVGTDSRRVPLTNQGDVGDGQQEDIG